MVFIWFSLFREALEIQVYQELLENQANQETQEAQWVLITDIKLYNERKGLKLNLS